MAQRLTLSRQEAYAYAVLGFTYLARGKPEFALAVSRKGTVLAFAERRTGLHDHAKNDIVLRRSADGGRTWGDLIVVAEEGDDSLNDPCVVVLDSGRVLHSLKRFVPPTSTETCRR